MKIVMILANACAPDPRVEKEAGALGAAGHDVTILAWDRRGEAPVFEERELYRIERVGPRAAYGGGLKNVPHFRAFWRRAAKRVVELAPNVIHCHDTDTAVAGLSALKRSRGRRTRLVVDFHELYRESGMVPQKGLTGFAARRLVDWIEKRAIGKASIVIVANPGTVDYFSGIGAKEKLVVIDNAPDPDLFVPQPCPEADRPFTVTFVGSKRYPRTLVALMDAVQERDDVRVVLAGGGPDADLIAELAGPRANVEVQGQVPYDKIPGYYACCDVVYAAYDARVGNARYAIPGKVLEAMGCAKPVIVSAGTWVGDYVTKNGVGLALACDDPSQIASAIEKLRSDPDAAAEMGQRGRAIVEDGLNWPVVAQRLVQAYASISAS